MCFSHFNTLSPTAQRKLDTQIALRSPLFGTAQLYCASFSQDGDSRPRIDRMDCFQNF